MEDRFTFMMGCLPSEWVPFEVLNLLFGIKQDDEQLWGRFRGWSARLRRPREVLRPDSVSRHAFESYLQQAQLLPVRQAGARLGMSETSFEALLQELEVKGLLVTSTFDVSPQVIPESLVRGFPEHFPALQHCIFGDHNDFCTRLHAAIREDLALEVDPIFCETSVWLGQDPPDHAYEYDCLTGAAIGLRYQVWLDFKKPINLRPDVCSLKLYADRKDKLREHVFGGRVPEIPDELSAAQSSR